MLAETEGWLVFLFLRGNSWVYPVKINLNPPQKTSNLQRRLLFRDPPFGFQVNMSPASGQTVKPGNLLLPVSGEHELRLFGGVDHDDLKPGATGQSEAQKLSADFRDGSSPRFPETDIHRHLLGQCWDSIVQIAQKPHVASANWPNQVWEPRENESFSTPNFLQITVGS